MGKGRKEKFVEGLSFILSISKGVVFVLDTGRNGIRFGLGSKITPEALRVFSD